jgi:DNA topoisomerase-1
VASRLGNTVAVCRKSYVHPSVLALLSAGVDEGACAPLALAQHRSRLPANEGRFVAFLSTVAAAAPRTRQRSSRR